MKKMYSKRLLSLVAATTILACFFMQAAFAADKTFNITFSTGQTATLNAGEDFVFAISCQPPTDITEIKVSGGTLTAEKTTLGGPSTPQGVINGLWTLSGITGDVTITLILNTQEGADLPVITTGKEAAEAAASSSGGMGGGGPGGGAPGGTPPLGGAPGGTPPTGAPTGAPSGAPGGTPPAGAPTTSQQ
ncbi:MAG: hypothetical protein JW944_08245 [Deltaproteobacteria bacterium]|nr:hypothetical protein [Deltaproteobacteria bacterium]